MRSNEFISENLKQWFKEKWVRFGPDGKIRGDCARGSDTEGKPKCLPQSKAQALGKKGRASAAAKKRREDPNPERRGPAKNVATKVKEDDLDENCWKGYHKEGNKELFGKTVPNCVKNESQEGVAESFIRDGADWDDALRELNVFNDVFLSPDIQDTHEYTRDPEWQELAKMIRNSAKVQEIYGQLKKFANLRVKLTSPEVKRLDSLVWDGGGDMDIDRLKDLYAHQLGAVGALLKTRGQNNAKSGQTMHEQGVAEGHESCPECGGAMYPDTMINEKQDACYFKVKSRYKVWPSAYASGALVQCRKKGAKNWGNKNESQENMMDELDRILELSTGMSTAERAELAEEFDLIESNIDMLAERNGVDAEAIWEDLESLTDDELYVFAATQPVMEDWQKANKKDRTAGMSQKAVNAYRRENPGSKLKTAVTTKPSKLKKGSKASKRRKSYCSRSRGQMKMHNISCAKTPDKAICAARRRWNCE
jgi:hypothetical protein